MGLFMSDRRWTHIRLTVCWLFLHSTVLPCLVQYPVAQLVANTRCLGIFHWSFQVELPKTIPSICHRALFLTMTVFDHSGL